MTATVGLLFLVFFCLLAIGVPVLASIGLGVIANSLMGGVVSLAYIVRNMVQALDSFTVLARSEERRVGKEWVDSPVASPWQQCSPVCYLVLSPAPARLHLRR